MPRGLVDQADDRIVREWIEREIGPVASMRREGRWRPAWFVDAQGPSGPVSLYVRGTRGGRWPARPLAYEARVHRVFEENGIKVPHLYGYIEEVPAIVMDLVPGRPNLSTAASEADRTRLREQLADQMRKIHELDPALIVAAGATMPESPKDITLSAYRDAERLYLTGETLPSPDIEFVRRWLDRNVPDSLDPPCVIAMDAGQFIFEGDELTAMLDFELVSIGDRHTDFCALRSRERVEGFDDPEGFYKLCEQRGARPIDIDHVRFQHIAFSLFTPLQIADDLARPQQQEDYHEYLIWHAISMKDALEGIAESIGIALEPYDLPAPVRTRWLGSLEALGTMVQSLEASDEFAMYRKDKIALALRYLRRAEGVRDAFAAEYVRETAELIGKQPASESDASEMLVAFIAAAGPEHDEALVRLLHRQVKRQAAILADEGTWLHQSLSTPLRPLRKE
jgi:aminoglycoside phosphotransferase (APT) family kinase protein